MKTKIVMKTIYAGPRGSYKPDQVVDMDSKEAKDLIDGGYAIEYVDPKKAAADKAKADEKAAKEKEAADKKAAADKAKNKK